MSQPAVEKNNSIYLAHGYLILATCLVAGSFIGADILADSFHPVSLTLLRFICAACILAPFVLINPKWRKSLVNIFPRALAISAFYCGFFIAQFTSLGITSTLNTGTLFTLVPFITAVMCLVVFKQAIKKRHLAIYIFGALGTCWVIFDGNLYGLVNLDLNYGDFIFSLGALSMCCYSVAMKWFYRGDHMLPLVFCTLLGGITWMTLTILVLDEPLQWQKLQGEYIYAMVYLVIGATFMTMYLYQKATVILGPNQVMAYNYMNPAALAILLFLFQGQNISWLLIPGILISAVCTVLLQTTASK